MVWIDDALVEILRYLPDQCEAAAMTSQRLPDDTFSLAEIQYEATLPAFCFLFSFCLFCLFSSGCYFETSWKAEPRFMVESLNI